MKGLVFLTVLLVIGCVAAYSDSKDDLTLRELLVKLKRHLETEEYAAQEELEGRHFGEYKRFSCLTGRVECPPDRPYCHDGPDGVGRCFSA
ncbi:uncharacterized protein LOC117299681 [Asterias rubens]|uniref:uncharacterized protein LOC117299681 n=1 Tax=Asterias rubens TaxID=7604 RepID=UPI00145502C9|nr:uncharacterized protein LOC117299681 [Asterias rubens]